MLRTNAKMIATRPMKPNRQDEEEAGRHVNVVHYETRSLILPATARAFSDARWATSAALFQLNRLAGQLLGFGQLGLGCSFQLGDGIGEVGDDRLDVVLDALLDTDEEVPDFGEHQSLAPRR
jgi:hypothetical protein